MDAHPDTKRIDRYRSQSLRLLESAMTELRSGRWNRSEEMLWGSLTLAVKGAALSRGDELGDDESVREYAAVLGSDLRDRRVRESFAQLASLTEALERARETRRRVEGVFRALDDISGAVERLWDLVDANQSSQESSA
ncbi:MAG: hypothetical protein F4X65_00325 [Chloroflexi bacterium]|nr:hypothetical protein [Chloroflexota bacterium]